MARTRTWLVVADAAQARIFAVDPVARALAPARALTSAAARRKVSELVSDRQGRAFESGSPGRRSAIEPRTDPQRHEQGLFLGDVAETLAAGARGRLYDRLVLVAAPRALGVLRGSLAPEVRERVVAEIDKDLVQLSPSELAAQLAWALFPG